MQNGAIETFESPLLADVQFNEDGSLKASGKQNIRFYNKKVLKFRAKPKLDAAGNPVKDEKGKIVFDIDPKTGLPFKEAFEDTVEMVRVETKGDTNIKDDVADEFSKRQFYRQYKFFREGKIPDGHPIEDFDFIQAPTLMELHMLGIHVIEQLAVTSDLVCEQIKDQSGFELRDIAAQWVRINSPDGQATKASALERQLIEAKREIENLKNGNGSRTPIRRIVEEPIAALPVEETMEITPRDLQKKRGRPSKASTLTEGE